MEEDFPETYLNSFAPDCISENWVFSKSDDETGAMIWNPDYQAKLGDYWLSWELDLAKIQGWQLLPR